MLEYSLEVTVHTYVHYVRTLLFNNCVCVCDLLYCTTEHFRGGFNFSFFVVYYSPRK